MQLLKQKKQAMGTHEKAKFLKEKSAKIDRKIAKKEKKAITKEKVFVKKEKTVSVKKVKMSKGPAQGGPMADGEINFANKDHLINELAIRWNYALPEWPPRDFDFEGALRANGLRRVEIKTWKSEPEEIDGLRKVYELPTFPGQYKDSPGKTYDMRP
jgi:hypothetical protein